MTTDRFAGALLGTALGDSIGAPFEGSPQVDVDDVCRWTEDARPLRWTDDTHMTIGVAESLLVRDGVDGAHMARRFCELHAAEPDRGYGAGPPLVFAAIRAGAPWD
jgi:poly(ADP-ribose) glycohydrolase ARH3